MALKKSAFFNFEELKAKEYDKKFIYIVPNPNMSFSKGSNKSSRGPMVGFLEEMPRISATAIWKTYAELAGEGIMGEINSLKETVAGITGNTSFAYGDCTAKFFTGGGEFQFDVSLRCISYTPWDNRYQGIVDPVMLNGKKYLIGDCREQYNNIFAMCFPAITEVTDTLQNSLRNAYYAGKKVVKDVMSAEELSIFTGAKNVMDDVITAFANNQPTVAVKMGNGNVSYFNSNKMIVRSVDSQYSEEWVKLNESSEPVPMFVDIKLTLELAQLAGLSDIASGKGAMKINFRDSREEVKPEKS